MRIGVIILDRGDRPEFLKNCKRMVRFQNCIQHDLNVVVIGNDMLPASESVDIVPRFRIGYDLMTERKVDVIAICENDDWYSWDYLDAMTDEWRYLGKPDIFGTNYTIYYHLKLKKHFTMNHPERASLMNTLIKPGLNIKWPADTEPYLDMALWSQFEGKTFKPSKIISVGMKHGIGLCGGANHNDRLHRYKNDDNGFLESTLDKESFEFYNNVFK